MLLELEIRQVCTIREKPYISFTDCVTIALRSKLIANVEQVKSMLLYHHLLGVLLYYPEVPGLCDYIIIDYQWFFDRLSQIVLLTYKQPSLNLHAAYKLKHSGILSKELIRELKWEGDINQDYVIALLSEMKIIAPISRQDGNGEDYFIPYVLPTYVTHPIGQDTLSQYGYLQGEPLFVSNLLPRGFFCCLVVEILQHLPNGWVHLIFQKQACHAYCNLITFCLHHGYYVSLLDKLSYLEVQIRHTQQLYYKNFPIHMSIQNDLARKLEAVCETLNFNQGRLRYGYYCQCGDFDDDHIATIHSTATLFDYAHCSYGSATLTKLYDSHTIWLTKVRFHHN